MTWVTREPAEALYPELSGDPLPLRRELYARARTWVRGDPVARHVGGAIVDAIQYNSATHRYMTTLVRGELPAVEESDQVIVNTGFGPDNSIYRELQIEECFASRGPTKLSEALRSAATADCLSTPAFGAEALEHPEPNFYILGHKSFGRSPLFLLGTGYRLVAEVVVRLSAGLGVPIA